MRAVLFPLYVITWTFYIWQLSNPDAARIEMPMNRVFNDSLSAIHVYDSMMSKAQSYGGVKVLWVNDSSFITNIQIGREY